MALITCEHVCLGYDGQAVLRDVNFTVSRGDLLCVVGENGSGKSTLAKLLVSFWEADRGRILLGGVDVRKLPLSQVMQSVAYVSQDNYLFDLSVMDNIRMGRKGAADILGHTRQINSRGLDRIIVFLRTPAHIGHIELHLRRLAD